ncbi:MAG: hypothetical protein PVH96_09065, partial [Gemmatimonadota bacterium]
RVDCVQRGEPALGDIEMSPSDWYEEDEILGTDVLSVRGDDDDEDWDDDDDWDDEDDVEDDDLDDEEDDDEDDEEDWDDEEDDDLW